MDNLSWYIKREALREDFYKRKKYLSLIDDIVGVNIDNDGYCDDRWNNEIDEMFDFLFDNAYKIMPFQDEIVISYKDKYVSLFEMHGQGCFRRISEVIEEPSKYISFSDIVRYYEFKEKPYKSYVSEIVDRALSTLKVANNSDCIVIDNTEINIDEVKDYIKLLINSKED